MRKNKLFIFFAILTVICIFSIAAIADRCGCRATPPEEKIDIGETEESAEEGLSEREEEISGEAEDEKAEESEEETTESEESTEEEETSEQIEQAEAPTIEIEVYEGPIYSSSDNVCYYRIKANVTGNPNPDVEFSKDDSGGAWGEFKCQINLNDPADTYTLIATATNSSGSATDSITLNWGCDGEEVVEENGEEDTIEITVTRGMSVDEAGWIIKDDGSCPGPICPIVVGDSSLDSPCRGFVSFDITDLTGVSIIDANLVFSNPEQIGDPYNHLIEAFWVKVVNWGDDALESSDYDLPSKSLGEYVDPNITINNSTLIDAIRTALGNGRTRFQIMISHKGYKTNNNAQNDYFHYTRENIHLYIRY